MWDNAKRTSSFVKPTRSKNCQRTDDEAFESTAIPRQPREHPCC